MDNSYSISSPQVFTPPNSSNKPIPYLPPEIVTEIVSYISEDDIKTLYSLIRINKTWFNCSIHILWKQPFKYASLPGYSKLLKIYIWFLPESTKTELRADFFKLDVKEFNKTPTVNYLNYLENLELEYRSLYWAIKLLIPTLEKENIEEFKEQDERKSKDLMKHQAHTLLKAFCELYKEKRPKLKKNKMNNIPSEISSDALDDICTNPTDHNKTKCCRRRRCGNASGNAITVAIS